MSLDLTSLEDWESALPHAVQEELETAFLRRYSWLRIGSKTIGCDSLLGRVRREFDQRTPSVFKVSKVRTRAQTSSADPCKRRRLSKHVSLTLVSELPEETPISGIMDRNPGCCGKHSRAMERLRPALRALVRALRLITSRACRKECLKCGVSTLKLHSWRTSVCGRRRLPFTCSRIGTHTGCVSTSSSRVLVVVVLVVRS